MAYRFSSKDPSVEAAVRRIALEQVEGALALIAGAGTDADRQAEATHEARKACKKLRALLRLVRPALTASSDAARENAAFRDLAQGLSGARDAKVLLDSFDRLMEDRAEPDDPAPGPLAPEALADVRAHLVETREARASGAGGTAALEGARRAFEDARERIGDWSLKADGWDALGKGVAATMRQVRGSWRAARASADPSAWHELRKPLKYHWYHTRLLTPLWPGPFAARAECLERVSEAVGFDHDVAVLADRLRAMAADGHLAQPKVLDSLSFLVEKRRARIEAGARADIERLIVRKPAALARDWGALWAIWREDARS